MATILLFQNPEHLQIPETVLDADALLRQPALGPALFFSQLGALALLERRPRGADLGKPLIAAVGDAVRRRLPVRVTALEQGEIMFPPFAKKSANYLRRVTVAQHLTFQRVLLPFAAVVASLFSTAVPTA